MTDPFEPVEPLQPIEPALAPDEGSGGGIVTEIAPPRLSPRTASLLELIDRLTRLLERSDLVELEVEAGATAIVLRKPAALPQPLAAPPAVAAGSAAPAAERTEPATPARARTAVVAPLTGIFYGSPSPDSPPYVVAGQHVVAGQVIGLIEAMKLFNEIKSDRSGRVARVLAESGKLVKAKQPLIEVEPA